jgi:hypothetical protein
MKGRGFVAKNGARKAIRGGAAPQPGSISPPIATLAIPFEIVGS